MKKRYESIEKPDKCPKCGAPVYRIQYGLPTMSENLLYGLTDEEPTLAGCEVR